MLIPYHPPHGLIFWQQPKWQSNSPMSDNQTKGRVGFSQPGPELFIFITMFYRISEYWSFFGIDFLSIQLGSACSQLRPSWFQQMATNFLNHRVCFSGVPYWWHISKHDTHPKLFLLGRGGVVEEETLFGYFCARCVRHPNAIIHQILTTKSTNHVTMV